MGLASLDPSYGQKAKREDAHDRSADFYDPAGRQRRCAWQLPCRRLDEVGATCNREERSTTHVVVRAELRDFEEARYTRSGPYVTMRFKFDQLSLQSLGLGRK